MRAASSLDVRTHLLGALEADLIGPFVGQGPDGRPSDEALSLPPSRWYLTGFLAPEAGRQDEDDPTEKEELAAGSDETDEESQGSCS